MVQLLASRYKRQAAALVLFVFLAETVFAGREYLFEEKKETEREFFIFPKMSYLGFSQESAGYGTMGNAQETVSDSKTGTNLFLQKEPEMLAEIVSDRVEDIGGPSQPEMAAFKAVGADNMVDLFTGDFSYNIPLGDVGGYPINIFYNSGISMDQEASWVGLGWNINPGTIMRNKRGIPDDFSGEDKITKEMNIKPQITVGLNASGKSQKEILGFPIDLLNSHKSVGLFYNNYRGIGLEYSERLTLELKLKNADSKTLSSEKASEPAPAPGTLQASLAFNVNSQSGISVNPSTSIKLSETQGSINYGTTTSLSANFNSRIGLQGISLSAETRKSESLAGNKLDDQGASFSSASSLTFGVPSITPSITMPLTHRNYNLGVSLGNEKKFLKFNHHRLSGYYSETTLRNEDKKQVKPAFGYLYYQEANGNKDAMLDFNRLNDGVYTKNNPVIAMPNYTYDVFSISGQGTGGGFRAYRGDVGSVHDNYTRTRENASSIDMELAAGDLAEFGLNLNYVHTPTTAGEWQTGNLTRQDLAFTKTDKLLPAAYFKNPGESAKIDPQFIGNLANEDLVRIKLTDPGDKIPLASPIWERFSDGQSYIGDQSFANGMAFKKKRDKRTQVISYLTAEEASYVGLDKKIYYYPVNVFPRGNCNRADAKAMDRYELGGQSEQGPVKARKNHHLSEITVTQTDGKRYVYGIPVYNLKEEEVSFNVSNLGKGPSETNIIDDDKQLVSYTSGDLSANTRGLDHFYQRDKIDPYAHSFLLSGLLSPDYVDVTGDGITDDDLGTAVKFNYSKIERDDQAAGRGFGWRAPFSASGFASYNEGLKTDISDDKGHFTYGERELWYLNSIESRNMIATFTVADREDGKAVVDEFGGAASGTGMKKLTKIDIYSKAEWIRSGNNKKPVKTIHFVYYSGSDELCDNTPDNPSGGGKLTLKSIWFTYNGNEKVKKNYYSFKYHSNPVYNRMANDRWGNYKPSADNALVDFAALKNDDFPYALQNKTKADLNAAAWTLNEITLPSGAKIKVDFESDDYAYVQNRRAAQMFKIAGFGKTKTATPEPHLYSILDRDNHYIFIDVPVPVSSKSDIKNKYLEGLNQLYMKLWVRMPSDQFNPSGEASKYETVSVYGKLIGDNPDDDYGMVSSNRIWIKVQRDKGNYSPMFYNAIQFMIRNLSSKAYPGSNVKNQGPMGILKALAGILFNQVTSMGKYYMVSRLAGTCKKVDLDRSYIRLNNPYHKKLGGGLRVKKVTIKDSWKDMSASSPTNNTDGMPESEYGQEYDYTTTALIGGEQVSISSGVASYEPTVGADENPFREILSYNDNQPLGPNQRGAVELPLGEVFYPNPSVGYSKVTVRSIHRDNVKSGVGRTVTEFYTTRDFPTKSDYTSFDPSSHVRFKSNPILRLLKLDVREFITLSQGFRLQTNDMNGKVRKQISYDEAGKQVTYTENLFRIVKTGENEFSFNNTVPMLEKPGGQVENIQMGKEIEVMTDFREHISRAVTFNLNLNVNVNEMGGVPVPVPSIIPPVHFAETGYRSASAVKIIHTFGILEKVIHIDKGSEVSTKDLLYDAETGNVLVTETDNEFNKPVYSFNYPAWWAYKGMEGAYKNIEAVFEHVRFQNGKLTTPGFDFTVFESGDELYVKDYSAKGAIQEPGCYPSGPVQYIPKPLDPENPGRYVRKIWALDMRKDADNTTEKFLFIDKDGEPYSGGDVTIKIIRSGKRNLVDASAGGFTSLVSPVRETSTGSGVFKLFADDDTKIINTTANTFKENWRVDEAWRFDSVFAGVVRKTPIRKTSFLPTSAATISRRHWEQGGWNTLYSFRYNTEDFFSNKRDHKRDQIFGKSYMLFDFSSITTNKVILGAKLSLFGHREGNYPHWLLDPYEDNGLNSHPVGYPHFGDYTFSIKRGLWQWPGNNQLPFQEYYWQHGYFDESTKIIKSPAFIGANIDASFCSNCGPGGTDNSLNITGMFYQMLEDKRNPAKNYSPTIQIQLESVNYHGIYACFNSGFLDNWAHPPVSTSRISKIEVEYYDCAEAYGLPGNPAEPPPGQATADCKTMEWTYSCENIFTRKRMNPYTKGVLGNWRADIGYVYYDSRREMNATDPTAELSKGGLIATGYKSFWINSVSGNNIEINPAATTGTSGNPAPWKWNSKVTQFNSKGFELENTDPLGRFNCGLYGYDRSLPVAVANNSKLRNAAYDGFEDYIYQSNNCAPYCKPLRHLVIENAASHIDNTVRHSGLSSLRTDAGQSLSIKANVVTKTADEAGYGINITTATTTMSGSWVNPSGTGIKGSYFNEQAGMPNFNPSTIENYLNNNWSNPAIRTASKINMYRYNGTIYASGAPPAGIVPRLYARWDGYVQAPLTGTYELAFSSDDGMKIWIDDVLITGDFGFDGLWDNHPPRTAVKFINWNIGTVHKIRIYYFDEGGDATAHFSWKIPFATEFETVPNDYLYLESADANGTLITGTYNCIKPDDIQVQGNAITDVFSPIRGQKMVFSAWVKEGTADCHCTNYANNKVEILYNNATTVSATLLPAGKVIEGWQRYEGVFVIPETANNIEIKMRSTGESPVYWDDVRVHPFNANMKSFVYHPVTLRLMAELDENNYTSFYEYDDDGTLTRVKKETERGVKTITETRSSLQKRITE